MPGTHYQKNLRKYLIRTGDKKKRKGVDYQAGRSSLLSEEAGPQRKKK